MLLDKDIKIIGQGITGAEGSTALEWMKKYGTQIVTGVTPGKGGQTVGDNVPIFNSVSEAMASIDGIIGSVIYVPPLRAKAAVFEAVEAGIKWILVVTERIPVKDSAEMVKKAKENGVQLVGPSSAGIINPSKNIKIGSIGGPAPTRAYIPGNISVISKSGSMTSEISLHLKNHDLGVSWAVCIGGDRIIGTDFVDFLSDLESDENTQASVIFGELGGTYEEKIAEAVKSGQIKKPVIAFIGGEFTMSLPNEVQFGHAGAIIEGKRGLPSEKRRILQEAGIKVAENFDQIHELVKQALNR